MKKKDLYKIINEEIGEFDFLGNDSTHQEEAHSKVLSSKEFQTALVHDLINRHTSDNIEKISATYSSKDSNVADNYPASVELELDVQYNYEGKKYNLVMFLDGEQSDEEINYDSFEITLFSKGGEEISLNWLDNNANLHNKLVKVLLAPYI